jgi:hypothetical protein
MTSHVISQRDHNIRWDMCRIIRVRSWELLRRDLVGAPPPKQRPCRLMGFGASSLGPSAVKRAIPQCPTQCSKRSERLRSCHLLSWLGKRLLSRMAFNSPVVHSRSRLGGMSSPQSSCQSIPPGLKTVSGESGRICETDTRATMAPAAHHPRILYDNFMDLTLPASTFCQVSS